MEIPKRKFGFVKSLSGFRPFYELNNAIDEYAYGNSARRTVRVMIGEWCLFGAGCSPDDHRWGTAASVFIVIANDTFGFWRDPEVTPWAIEHKLRYNPDEKTRSDALAYAREMIDVREFDDMLNWRFGLWRRKQKSNAYAKEVSKKFDIDMQVAREIVAQACRRNRYTL